MRALDPVHGRGEGEYERLRRARLLSTGLRTKNNLGVAEAGQALTLYCSLNRDAISAVRRGHSDIAREIHDHAQRIETTMIAPWLEAVSESWLSFDASASEPVDEDDVLCGWTDHLFFAAAPGGEQSVAEPIWDAARAVAEVRTKYAQDDPHVRLTIGRVWRMDDSLSEIRPESPDLEESFAFFTDELLEAGLRLGDPVVIRHEELGRGVFLTTFERGLERAVRTSRISGQPLPQHLEELLDT